LLKKRNKLKLNRLSLMLSRPRKFRMKNFLRRNKRLKI